MTITPFPGFQTFPTRHCVTGSMRHLYAMLGRDVSEELLLGLGAGVGFVYWHQKGAPPFLGGRADVGRPGEEGLEVVAGRRTGVAVTASSTTNARRAEAALVDGLSAERPAIGVRGIRKAAHLVPQWPDTLDGPAVRDACRDAFVMIDATGGTGGGLFRYMYGRFLEEAATLTGDTVLGDVARRLTEAGDRWQDAATAFDRAARDGDPAPHLATASAALTAAADVEVGAWHARIGSVVRGVTGSVWGAGRCCRPPRHPDRLPRSPPSSGPAATASSPCPT